MSYARFSTDDFLSDVYVYADATGGYTVMIASSHAGFDRSKLPEITANLKEEPEKWSQQSLARRDAISEQLTTVEYKYYEHPLAGTQHYGMSAEHTYHLLKYLEFSGFHIPDATAENVLADGDERSPLSEGQSYQITRPDEEVGEM